jgi:hypothetical protein
VDANRTASRRWRTTGYLMYENICLKNKIKERERNET